MDRKLELELAKGYYRLAVKSSLVFYLLILLICYVFWGYIPSTVLLLWAGVNVVTATLFLIAAYLFNRHATEESANQWLKRYTYLVILHDIPWGLIGPLIYTIDIEVYQLLSLFLLGGITAGGIIARASIFTNYFISIFSLLLPISVMLALEHSENSLIMLSTVVIYVAFMLSTAKDYSQTIIRNIQLWLENEKLVSKLKSSHGVIQEAKERAEQANQAKSQFLATISHELRTPLNGIVGFTDLLLREPLEQQYRQSVVQIEKASHNLLNIVKDILDIAAIEQGHIHFYEESFSLRRELNDLVLLLQPMASKKGLPLTLKIETVVEDILLGDVSRLRQILSNLLSNGIKYTEAGSVELNISVAETLHNSMVLCFEVRDTGVGIPAHEIGTIFDNFTRLEGFETQRNEGTGLGLAIVKNLLNKLGGTLKVESQVGQGSCFRFTLNFEFGNEFEAIKKYQNKRHQSIEQLTGLKVLIVDDNEINRMLLSTFLSKMSVTHDQVSNGTEALQRIRDEIYHAVLLDIQMPDISGLEVARRVMEESMSPPVLIAVSAHAYTEQRNSILDAGFSDYLTKPVLIDELSKVLTQVYDSSLSKIRIVNSHP
jgi:signal transduction histidine kinase/ActR/RegA family two-component response regulator